MDQEDKPLTVCVVEDNEDLREDIVETLCEAGFDVRGFPASRELYASMLAAPCDIAILDIGLPGEDGFSIMRRLCKVGSMGIIMLTARSAIDDRVRALTQGADAYLVKPVDLAELQAVVLSMGRRLRSGKAGNPPHRHGDNNARAVSALPSEEASGVGSLGPFRSGQAAKPGNWTLMTDGWILVSPQGDSLVLTAQERLFWQYLSQHPGEVVSREALAQAIGGDPYEFDLHRLDSLINRLRKKATQQGLTLPLRTVRGAGYLFLAADEP